MAAGTPVIAYRGGGYLESVVEEKTGLFFDEPTVDSLIKTLNRFNRTKFEKRDLINQAKKFSKERFKEEIKNFISENIRSN